MTINEILTRLSDGNTRFITDKSNGNLRDNLRRKSIIDEQNPFAIVLSCADSRVVPELIFDTGLGELFVIRVAGNIASKTSVATIEYAVSQLKTKLIIVMGHQNCGAVIKAIEGGDNGENLNHLLSHLTPAISASAKTTTVNDVVKLNAKLTAEELKNRSKIIKNAVDNGSVEIIPAYYNMDSGLVDFWITT